MQRSYLAIILAFMMLLAVEPAVGQPVATTRPATRDARMVDIPASAAAKITVERRGDIVLIGINRPGIQNRLDPEAYLALAKAYYDYDYDYDYDHDPSLRAAVLFGHGANFSRGIDVDGFKAVASSGGPRWATD
jgi:enoyl-CoA hydratase